MIESYVYVVLWKYDGRKGVEIVFKEYSEAENFIATKSNKDYTSYEIQRSKIQ
ncbi:hypothetical protein [uncultured Metabacillus sp.]|uniref:hypothetical protein n=1 Tax=Metabacillus sp. Hm71 TaxID=3450743 RepID=UPI002628F582|nr:hypothetical protein [uncultured Metabacillus sp.]